MSIDKYDFILTIDQGGHASRATIYSREGELVAQASLDIATERVTIADNSFIQHDVKEIDNSIKTVVQECQRQMGQAVSRDLKIKAGIATQRSTIVCWNFKTQEILSAAISWQDTRGALWLDKFNNKQEYIKNTTGLYLSAHYGVSKINWCLQNLEAVKKALNKNELCIGPLSSYLLYSCVDNSQCIVDHANAARTLLLNRNDLDWDQNLLDLFFIPKSILPKCVTSKSSFGQLRHWQGQCDVQVCTGDQSAAIFSQGKPASNEFTVNIGSGAFILNINNNKESIARILSGSIYTYYKDSKLTRINALEGTVNSAGIALDWLQAQNSGVNIYESLPAWLQQFSHDIPLFINGISGIGSPYWKTSQQSYFIGESTLATKAIAVIESIVFLITVNVQLMTVDTTNSMKVSGGLSVLQGLCQKLADLNQMMVYRHSDTEATLQGLFYLVSGNKRSILMNDTKKYYPKVNQVLLDRFSLWKKEMPL